MGKSKLADRKSFRPIWPKSLRTDLTSPPYSELAGAVPGMRRAAAVGIISVSPLGNTARTSRARMVSFTFSLRVCLRGGNFLPGVMS